MLGRWWALEEPCPSHKKAEGLGYDRCSKDDSGGETVKENYASRGRRAWKGKNKLCERIEHNALLEGTQSLLQPGKG